MYPSIHTPMSSDGTHASLFTPRHHVTRKDRELSYKAFFPWHTYVYLFIYYFYGWMQRYCRSFFFKYIYKEMTTKKEEEDNQATLDQELLEACRCGEKYSVVFDWICKGAKAHKRTQEEGFTSLHFAASRGNAFLMWLLVYYGGADINDDSNSDMNTPLHTLLLGSNVSGWSFRTFLQLYCHLNDDTTVLWMLASGAKVDARNRRGLTPLQLSLAYLHNNPDANLNIIRHLVKYGAKVETDPRRTPLHYIVENCFCQFDDVASILLPKETDIDIRNKMGYSPLHFACKVGNLPAVKWLLEKGASVEARSNRAETPLHLACASGHSHLIDILMQYHSNPNARIDCIEDTCFTCAYRMDHLSVMKKLCFNVSSSRLVNEEVLGKTCLHLACSEERIDMISALLLMFGADPNKRDSGGMTAMEILLKDQCWHFASLLIYKGAIIDDMKMKQMYKIYKNADKIFVNFLIELSHETSLHSIERTKDLITAATRLNECKCICPEEVYGNLIASIRLRSEYARRIGGGDPSHKHFIKVLTRCKELLKKIVQFQSLMGIQEFESQSRMEPQSGISRPVIHEEEWQDYPLSDFVNDDPFPEDLEECT